MPGTNIVVIKRVDCIFLRFCLCIFESATVKAECPVQIFRNDKIFKDLIQTLLVLLFFSEDIIKEKKRKKKLRK